MLDLLPDTLAKALGSVVADVQRECRREIDLMSAESRALIAELKAQVAELQAQVGASLEAAAARMAEAVAAIGNGEPGKDADPQVAAEIAAKLVSDELTEIIKADIDAIRSDVEAIGAGVDEKIADRVAAVAGLPAPKDGEPDEPGPSVDPDEVRAIVVAEVEDALKARPVPADGHTPTAEELAPIIQDAVRAAVDALPRPKDGVDGAPGQDGAPGRDGVGVASISREGVRLEIELDDGRVFDAGEIVGAKGDRGESGVGVAGALIDRAGSFVVTLSDGTTRDLGPAVGRDGVDGIDGKTVDPAELAPLVEDEVRRALERGTEGDYAPDDLVETISKAITMLAEAPAVTASYAPSIAPARAPYPARKRITTHRDEQGNLIADVVEF